MSTRSSGWLRATCWRLARGEEASLSWILEHLLEHILPGLRRNSDIKRPRVWVIRAVAVWVAATRQGDIIYSNVWIMHCIILLYNGLCKWIEINKSLTAGDFGAEKRTDTITQTRDWGGGRRWWEWRYNRSPGNCRAQCILCATKKCEISRVSHLIVSAKGDLRKDRYDEIRRILIKIAQGY